MLTEPQKDFLNLQKMLIKITQLFVQEQDELLILAGMCASLTKIPVIGVPIKDKKTDGVSALFSVAEMPNGIPVATTAINGALNAGLLAISIIALQDKKVRIKLENYRARQTKSVKKRPR